MGLDDGYLHGWIKKTTTDSWGYIILFNRSNGKIKKVNYTPIKSKKKIPQKNLPSARSAFQDFRGTIDSSSTRSKILINQRIQLNQARKYYNRTVHRLHRRVGGGVGGGVPDANSSESKSNHSIANNTDTISNMRLEPFTSYNCNIYNKFSRAKKKFGFAAGEVE